MNGMIREALDRMALGERVVLAGVEVERVSLLGFRVGAGPIVEAWQMEMALVRRGLVSMLDGAAEGDRERERLQVGAPETEARIEALRRQHGRALRVTGGARAKRARWTKAEAWLVVSYPKEAR